MLISSIYETYRIPESLQRHMLRVASVGSYVSSKFSIEVDRRRIITALLLHDMGNLIKFDLNSLALFEKGERDSKRWQQVQKDMIERYGRDERLATLAIVKEICQDKEILRLVKFVDIQNLSPVLNTDDFNVKIGVYSDFRVGMNGYVSVTKRFEDIIKRYGNRPDFMGKQKAIEKRDLCIKLEKQIENRGKLDLDKLPIRELLAISKQMLNFPL